MTQATESKSNQILVSQAEVNHNLRDVYSHLQKITGTDITYLRFKKVYCSLMRALMDYVLEGYFFKMPYNLGILRIKKRKLTLNKKMLRVNFAETRKHGKTIYHLNEHSNGFYYKFSWQQGFISGIKKYSFVPVRNYKRELARNIIDHKKDYAS